MRRSIVLCLIVFVCLVISSTAIAQSKARMPAIRDAADRLLEIQLKDPDWEGAFDWYGYKATNITGVTAKGLLEASVNTKEAAHLEGCRKSVSFLTTHLGIGATGKKHFVRMTAPDVEFLHDYAKATSNSNFAQRAVLEWNNIKTTRNFLTASDVAVYFRKINRQLIPWDLYYMQMAALKSGDVVWANQAAEILADKDDPFNYGSDNPYLVLNYAGAVIGLVEGGYYRQYKEQVDYFLQQLIALSSKDNGVHGWYQETSYTAIAFAVAGKQATPYANELAKWLASHQAPAGGWVDENGENSEINGEALRAMALTIGNDFGGKASFKPNFHWQRAEIEPATPFQE